MNIIKKEQINYFLPEFIKLTRDIHKKIHNGKTSFDNQDKLAAMVKLSEETGELAEQILGNLGFQRSDKDHLNQEELENEIADVIMSLIMLAHTHKIDINQALGNKLGKLKTRFGLDKTI